MVCCLILGLDFDLVFVSHFWVYVFWVCVDNVLGMNGGMYFVCMVFGYNLLFDLDV